MGRLQTGRLENFVRRWGSIKGGGSVLSETLGDVFPILDLENLTTENQLPAGWRLYWGFINVTAVAAQLAGASLVNPADSGNLVVVEHLHVRRQTTGIITIGTNLPLFALAAGTISRDTRGPGPIGDVRIGANTNVGASGSGFSLRIGSADDTIVTLPNGLVCLAPGTQLAVVNGTVNDDIFMSFAGRVRLAESSELSF